MRIKGKIVIMIILAGLYACNDNVPTVASLKNGKYFYYAGKDRRKISIDRQDSVQTERDPNTGKKLHMQIDWKSDRAYTLTWKMDTTGMGEADKAAPPASTSERIVAISKDYYLVAPGHKEENLSTTDTIWIEKTGN